MAASSSGNCSSSDTRASKYSSALGALNVGAGRGTRDMAPSLDPGAIGVQPSPLSEDQLLRANWCIFSPDAASTPT